MLDHFGVAEENWRDAIAQDRHYSESETPHFVGRAVAALAADPDVMAKTGETLSSWGLSREYGFEDIDGRRPDWGAYYERVVLGRRAGERLRRRDRQLAGHPLVAVDGVGDVHRVLGLVPAPEHQAGVGLHRVLARRDQLAVEHERAAVHLEVASLLLLDAVHEHLERALDVGGQRHA